MGQHLDDYFARRSDVKSSTQESWSHSRRNLIEYFGSDKRLASVTAGEARDFERYLKTEARSNTTLASKGLGSDTARKRIGHAKQFFGDAVEHEFIDKNPFAKLKGSVLGNRDRDFFVTHDMVAKVLEACPSAQWRLMVALSRSGGLRCPSEVPRLRLDAVDWDKNRLRVDSPKTEHHDGKAYRIIPIFPELRPFLNEVWDEAEEGQEYFITRYRAPRVNLYARLRAIVKRAGLTPWPKIWHNMRASRQTELEDVFPSHVVCQWMGNSIQVARKHYLQTTDAHFEKATASKCDRFVASSAPQEVANEKINAEEIAHVSNALQSVATPDVLLGQRHFGWGPPSLMSKSVTL